MELNDDKLNLNTKQFKNKTKDNQGRQKNV
jgi:hypothetical protein